MVGDMIVRPFTNGDHDEVVRLWAECGLTTPWNDATRDIARKRAVDPAGFLVGVVDGDVVATVMAGYDGHRGWINYLGVTPSQQGAGRGAAMMRAAEELLRARGCPKINLQIRTSNAAAAHFYESIGYAPDDVVSMSLRLVDDTTP